jgi:hypothetical protein
MADHPSIPTTRFSTVATVILKQGELYSLSLIFESKKNDKRIVFGLA